MTDQVKELISALIDGEASEIEIHRLLRQIKEDSTSAHREVWVTYQETRRVLRTGSQTGNQHLNRQQHLELHQRISDAVAEDGSYSTSDSTSDKSVASMVAASSNASLNNTSRSSIYRPAAGLAVAASLVVALFVGFQQLSQPEQQLSQTEQQLSQTEQQAGAEIVSDTSQPIQSSTVQSSTGQVSPIATQPVVPGIAGHGGIYAENEYTDSNNQNEPELRELDAEGQKRLRAYLNQHDALARKHQNTQLVNYSKPRDE